MIWRDGHIFESAQDASIAADSRGLLLGDGVFETLLVRNGRICHFERHWARLSETLKAAGLPQIFAANDISDAADTILSQLNLSEAVIRLSIASGSGPRGLARSDQLACHWMLQAHPFEPQHAPFSIEISTLRRHSSAFTSRHKTLSYMDHVIARRRVGADEALLMNEYGRASCATIGNIFIVRDHRALTPPLTEGVLNGIVRALVLEKSTLAGYDIAEGEIDHDALIAADHIIMTNSVVGARAVHRLILEDGQIFDKDTVSCTRLIESMRALAYTS